MTVNREISFTIRQKIGILAVYQSGWRKEVNLVEWNGGPAKVDIRDWDPKHEHMGKGVTLRPEEAEKLQWTLYRYFRGNGAGLLKDRQPPAGEPAVPQDDSGYDLPQTPVSADQDFPEPDSLAEQVHGGQQAEPESMFCSGDCMLDVDVQETWLEGALLDSPQQEEGE